jgi:hypothetical protein
MKAFIKQMFSSKDGDISHKRILGSIGFLALVFTMVANSFSPLEIAPSPELVSAVEYLVMSTVFGSVLEKFAKNGN